jgi:tRNA-dihydrouridine synthase
MIGRAAMGYPWVFREAREYLETGNQPAPVTPADRWALITRHARLAIARGTKGGELHTMMSLRSRFMAYTKGLPGGKHLRQRFSHVASIMELEDIAVAHLDGRLHESDEHAHALSVSAAG